MCYHNEKLNAGENAVSLSVDTTTLTTKGAKFTLSNNSDDEYTYGADYRIDKKVDNEWKELETEGTLAWNSIGYISKANISNEVNIDLHFC